MKKSSQNEEIQEILGHVGDGRRGQEIEEIVANEENEERLGHVGDGMVGGSRN